MGRSVPRSQSRGKEDKEEVEKVEESGSEVESEPEVDNDADLLLQDDGIEDVKDESEDEGDEDGPPKKKAKTPAKKGPAKKTGVVKKGRGRPPSSTKPKASRSRSTAKGRRTSQRARNQVDDDESEDGPSPEYEVEQVRDVRDSKKDQEFLIKWKGYNLDQCTWEPRKHLGNSEELIKFYLSQNPKYRRACKVKTTYTYSFV